MTFPCGLRETHVGDGQVGAIIYPIVQRRNEATVPRDVLFPFSIFLAGSRIVMSWLHAHAIKSSGEQSSY